MQELIQRQQQELLLRHPPLLMYLADIVLLLTQQETKAVRCVGYLCQDNKFKNKTDPNIVISPNVLRDTRKRFIVIIKREMKRGKTKN
jgi:hypothetical protein